MNGSNNVTDDSHLPVWAQRQPDGLSLDATRRMREAAGFDVGRFREGVEDEEFRLEGVCDEQLAHSRAAAYLRDMLDFEARPEQRWALGLASEVLMFARAPNEAR